MNSILIAKMVANKNLFAGRHWFYTFRELSTVFEEASCKRNSTKLLDRYSKLTRNWTKETNSEWLCRIYLSAKMVMCATLNLNTLDYAQKKNVRAVESYLAYYSLLSLLRAIVYTLPEIEWDSGKLVKVSHSKAIKQAVAHIATFDKSVANSTSDLVRRLKAERELISYRSPSSGDQSVSHPTNIRSIATLLAEIAQFNSELLEASILKNAPHQAFEFLDEYINELSNVEIDGLVFSDNEDTYRLDYLSRKHPVTPNILNIMTEGHVESYFGAWVSDSDEDRDDTFDPDKNWQLIFDIP